MENSNIWQLMPKQLPKRMLQCKKRKDGKQEQNVGSGCTNRRLVTQLLIQVELNYGGRPSGGEWRKNAAKMALAH